MSTDEDSKCDNKCDDDDEDDDDTNKIDYNIDPSRCCSSAIGIGAVLSLELARTLTLALPWQ